MTRALGSILVAVLLMLSVTTPAEAESLEDAVAAYRRAEASNAVASRASRDRDQHLTARDHDKATSDHWRGLDAGAQATLRWYLS